MKINSIFQWHDKPQQINKLCCEQCRYKLLTPSIRLLPFQFAFAASTSNAIGFTVRNIDTNIVYPLPLGVLKTRQFSDVKYLYYEGDYIGLTLPCGYYVGEITDDTSQIYTSSEFYVMGAVFSENLAPTLASMTFGPNWSDTVNGWCKPSGVYDTITIPCGLVAGKTYKVVLEYTKHVGQAVTIDIGMGSSTSHPATNMVGIFEFTGVAGAGTDVVIGSTTLNNVCFANIKVYEVIDNIGQCNYHLRFNNCSQVGNVIYSDTLFYQEFFIDAESEVYNRTPKRITEVSKNIDGSETPIFERLEYTQDLYLGRMPKEIADALVTIPLHDYTELIAKKFYSIDKILSPIITASSSEETNYCFTDVSLNFQYDDAIVKTNCCDNSLIAIDEKKCVGVARLKLEGEPNINGHVVCSIGGIITTTSYLTCIFSPYLADYLSDLKLDILNAIPTLGSFVEQYNVEFIDNELIMTVLVTQSQIANAPRGFRGYNSTVPFIYQCCINKRFYYNNFIDTITGYPMAATPHETASGVCVVPYRTRFTVVKYTIDGVDKTPLLNYVDIDFDAARLPTNTTRVIDTLPYGALFNYDYANVNDFINSISPLIQFSHALRVVHVLDDSIEFKIKIRMEYFVCKAGVFSPTNVGANGYGSGGNEIIITHVASANQALFAPNDQQPNPIGYETFIENCTI